MPHMNISIYLLVYIFLFSAKHRAVFLGQKTLQSLNETRFFSSLISDRNSPRRNHQDLLNSQMEDPDCNRHVNHIGGDSVVDLGLTDVLDFGALDLGTSEGLNLEDDLAVLEDKRGDEVVVTPLLSILLGNLNNIAVHHVMLAWNMEKEHDELIGSVRVINSVVCDAERKQLISDPVRIWLTNLRDVADDAVDLFDEIVMYRLKQKMKAGKLYFRIKMGGKLRKLRDRLAAAASDKGVLLSVETPETKFVSSATSLQNPCVYGRDVEKEEVVRDLVSGPCSLSTLSTYAVCGMGGIGKTTLVQLVYNDPKVLDHFHLRMWVSVSEAFDVSQMTSAMLECITGIGTTCGDLNSQQRVLQNELKGKRFLLVLDNVWNEDTENWKRVMFMLNSGARGSIVMMTMRNERVASSLRPLYLETPKESPKEKLKVVIHIVNKLNEDESWKLFKDYAFLENPRQEENDQERVRLGTEMSIKCSGVPLAIITLGSMIQRKRGLGTWKSIVENMSWDNGDAYTSIMPILRLSYFHMPLHLRPCFTYCSIFPKGYVYSKDQLILMWISNGFIVPEDDEDFYGKADEIFLDLVQRSFFQSVVERYGNTSFKIHDLMHDLATSIMIDMYSITDTKRASMIPYKVHHLYLRIPQNYSIGNIKIGSLRSLLLSSDFNVPTAHSLSSYIEKEKHLRVLDISGFRVRDSSSEFTEEKHELVLDCFNARIIPSLFPKAIAKLKHLRYLDMSYSAIESLPKSVGFLLNLQCLKLRYCFHLRKLPNSMKHLINLIVLDFRNCPSLKSLPPGIGKLKNLQMLGRYIVAEGIDCGLSELSGLNLRGVLRIEDLDKVNDVKAVENLNIGNKENLHSLKLYWKKCPESATGSDGRIRYEMMGKVLDGLSPPEKLKRLSLSLYQGFEFPEWIMQTRQLTKISLKNVDNCEYIPPLWKLPCLEVLVLRGMKMLKCFFNNNDYDVGMMLFPALKLLEITSMPNLKGWTATGLNRIVFPKVCQLKVRRCDQLEVLPSCPTLQWLQITQTPSMNLEPFPEGNSLTSFSLYDFSREVFPTGYVGSLKALEFLELWNMPLLNSISTEIKCLSKLRNLSIHSCPQLRSLPQGLKNLSALENLEVVCVRSLNSIPLGIFPGLSSLRVLRISQCESLTSLPDEIGCLWALRSLYIGHCDALNTLPTDSLQQLSYLWNVNIWNCKGLEKSDNTGWLQRLSSLSCLSIANCFDLTSLLAMIANIRKLDELVMNDFLNLEMRCKKDSGPDWQKISHVRTVWINGILIQSTQEN